MITLEKLALLSTRRAFLADAAKGVGSAALACLLGDQLFAGNQAGVSAGKWTGVVSPVHHPPKVKRVIHLCMAGGPSQFETFTPKPKLAQMDGKLVPASFTEGQPVAQLQGKPLKCFAPRFPFKQVGKAGMWMTDVFPHMHAIADDICMVHSMVTEQINHDPAHAFMNTGSLVGGRPSMGAWILYGLGAETEELPGFIVLTSEGGGEGQPIAARQWSSGFLPGQFQGVQFNSSGDPVHYVSNPPGVNRQLQREVIQTVRELNTHQNRWLHDPDLETSISQYELAFKMQAAVPKLTDLSQESASTLEMYGATPGDGSFASNCLLARRLAERGVRFIQLYHRGWDHHGGIKKGILEVTKHVDQATAALIQDLKQRDMLKDTLVIWGGEFGRTPMAQGTGRDHHIKGFTLWMAGGGIKSGFSYGQTDELGYHATEDVVHVRDFHATMLHLLGIDHNRLTYRYQGLDVKLTGVEPADVVHGVLS